MLGFILRRLALVVPVLIGVSIVIFLTVKLVPGDPVETLLGPSSPLEAREALRRTLGLDRPLPEQYALWLWNMAHLNLGTSIARQEPVGPLVWQTYGNTIILAAGGVLWALVIGLPVGVLSAMKQRSWFDRASMGTALFFTSMPPYWLSLVLIILLSLGLGLFPVSGMQSVTGEPGLPDLLHHLILPSFATAVVPGAILARTVRSAMLEVTSQDFVRVLRAKGLHEWQVVGHVLRNALPPIAVMLGLQLGYLLSGAVFVEVVFAWPGIGQLIYRAISYRDLPVIQGAVLLVALTFVLVNLVVDVINAFLDPRIRHA